MWASIIFRQNFPHILLQLVIDLLPIIHHYALHWEISLLTKSSKWLLDVIIAIVEAWFGNHIKPVFQTKLFKQTFKTETNKQMATKSIKLHLTSLKNNNSITCRWNTNWIWTICTFTQSDFTSSINKWISQYMFK